MHQVFDKSRFIATYHDTDTLGTTYFMCHQMETRNESTSIEAFCYYFSNLINSKYEIEEKEDDLGY